MTTSLVMYFSRDCLKARKVLLQIRDAEYQLALRALRKGETPPVFGAWRNCRQFLGLWELTTAEPTMPVKRVTLRQLLEDETIDSKALRTACG